MFKPIPMQRIFLNVLTEDVPLTARVLGDCGVFNPEICEADIAEQMPDKPSEDFRQIFHSVRSRLGKILDCAPCTMPADENFHRTVSLNELQKIDEQLGDIWQQLSVLEEEKRSLQENQITLKQLVETLGKFSGLNVDLSLLQKERQFLNLQIGTVPLDNLSHLQEAVTLAEHITQIFHCDENIAYFVVAGPFDYQEQVQSVLEHAEFQPLNIPTQFQARPQKVYADLNKEINALNEKINAVSLQQQEIIAQNEKILIKAYHRLNRATAHADLAETLRGRGNLALIEGWIPRTNLDKLEISLREKLPHPFVLNSRKPLLKEYAKVPSLLRHHRFLSAFMTLVKNYGIPRYGEFDPTILFAITFVVMFGMMFGDVGHGAVIAGGAWIWRDKLKRFTFFLIAAGISSIIFGFLYGSIFGFEEKIIPALWMSPLHDPFLMLEVALYWGMGFILIATSMTIINRWQEGHYIHALFDSTGVAGILLYLGGFYAAQRALIDGVFNTHEQLAVGLPLLLILGYKWFENKIPFGERVLVTLIEGFDSVLSYVANTLSFLRVAAFSLNHVALAIAVFTIAGMLGTVGEWIVIILGNIFIIIVEGAIVTIQILRLEYYEGFSRFFNGDGRAFSPLRSGNSKNVEISLSK